MSKEQQTERIEQQAASKEQQTASSERRLVSNEQRKVINDQRALTVEKWKPNSECQTADSKNGEAISKQQETRF